MVKEFVLDANAVLRYLRISAGGGAERVQSLVEQSERDQTRVLMSSVNLGEVFYIMRRIRDEETTTARLETVQQAITIIAADLPHSLAAARLKHRHKLSYADCFAAALALVRNATLVSADPAFAQCGRTLKWLRLPAYRG